MFQDVLSEVVKVCSPMKLKVFVDDVQACLEGRNTELSEIAEKVLKTMRMEVEKKGLKLSFTEGGMEGNSKFIAPCRYVDEKFQECSERGVGIADSVKTSGVDLRRRTKQLRANEKTRWRTRINPFDYRKDEV